MIEFEFINNKYNIKGFEVNEREAKQYTLNKLFTSSESFNWLFNINDKLIGFNNSGNYHLNSNSALVENNYFFILTDFDYYKINLENLECLTHINLEETGPFKEMHRFNKGLILIGENSALYIENNKKCWQYSTLSYIEYANIVNDDLIEVKINKKNEKIFINKIGKILK